MKLGENFGEREFEDGVFGAEDVAFEFLKAREGCCDIHMTCDRVEQPEVTQPRRELFVDASAQIPQAPLGERSSIYKNAFVVGERSAFTYMATGVARMPSSFGRDPRQVSNLCCKRSQAENSLPGACSSSRIGPITTPHSCNKVAARQFSSRRRANNR